MIDWQGNPLSRDALLMAGMARCKICAIFSACERRKYSDDAMIDSKVLLCALTIKTMTFARDHEWKEQHNTIVEETSNDDQGLW